MVELCRFLFFLLLYAEFGDIYEDPVYDWEVYELDFQCVVFLVVDLALLQHFFGISNGPMHSQFQIA